MSDKPTPAEPDLPPVPTPEERDDPRERDGRSDQIGILPGKIPGQPVDPGDPRFPGSQPDLA